MTTSNITATSSWAATSLTGAKDYNLQNVGSGSVFYFVGTTTPASTYVGMILRPFETHPVVQSSGETLYVRAFESASVELRATDA